MGEVFLELVALPLGQRGIPGRGDAPAIPEDVAQDRPDVGGVGHHLREDVDHAVANGLEGRRPGIGVELQLGVRPVLENGVEVGQRGVGEPDGLGDGAETLLPRRVGRAAAALAVGQGQVVEALGCLGLLDRGFKGGSQPSLL